MSVCFYQLNIISKGLWYAFSGCPVLKQNNGRSNKNEELGENLSGDFDLIKTSQACLFLPGYISNLLTSFFI